MPVGSPGMEGPNATPYPIVAFKADGSTLRVRAALNPIEIRSQLSKRLSNTTHAVQQLRHRKSPERAEH